MSMTQSLLIRGMPGSPYTRKMVALLRYRHIPYRWLLARNAASHGLPAAKVELLPTLYFRDDRGELEAVVDSTPIIRRLEAEYPGRSVIPADPVMAFLDELVEDYADEWLTKAMFHYRWYYADDIEMAGEILPRWGAITGPEVEMQQFKKYIQERQISRLYVVGSNDVTAPVIEASYARFLGILRSHLETQPFLFGRRPASSDFATYGQLTQLTHFDPTPSRLTLRQAPRVYAWVDLLDDQSGLEVDESGWTARAALPDTLRALLAEIGRVYVPVLLANAAAVDAGATEVRTTIDGQTWVQQPFPYQARCLAMLRRSRAMLDVEDRAAVDALLADTGCAALFT